jgi:hypothetical protein
MGTLTVMTTFTIVLMPGFTPSAAIPIRRELPLGKEASLKCKIPQCAMIQAQRKTTTMSKENPVQTPARKGNGMEMTGAKSTVFGRMTFPIGLSHAQYWWKKVLEGLAGNILDN